MFRQVHVRSNQSSLYAQRVEIREREREREIESEKERERM